MIAAFVIGAAVVKTFGLFVLQQARREKHNANERLRVQFGSTVAVSLELLLGADVLATAVAPSWNDVGKLAAIALIRTFLNYFLERDLVHLNGRPIKSTEPSAD